MFSNIRDLNLNQLPPLLMNMNCCFYRLQVIWKVPPLLFVNLWINVSTSLNGALLPHARWATSGGRTVVFLTTMLVGVMLLQHVLISALSADYRGFYYPRSQYGVNVLCLLYAWLACAQSARLSPW